MAEFPWQHVKVDLDGYEIGPGVQSVRSTFDSGTVSQRRFQTRNWSPRTFTIHIKVSSIPAFKQWQDATRDEFFDFRDWEDRVVRRVRVVGGAHNIALSRRGRDFLEGERYLSGQMTVEGYV